MNAKNPTPSYRSCVGEKCADENSQLLQFEVYLLINMVKTLTGVAEGERMTPAPECPIEAIECLGVSQLWRARSFQLCRHPH
jgi:hypothetical protein